MSNGTMRKKKTMPPNPHPPFQPSTEYRASQFSQHQQPPSQCLCCTHVLLHRAVSPYVTCAGAFNAVCACVCLCFYLINTPARHPRPSQQGSTKMQGESTTLQWRIHHRLFSAGRGEGPAGGRWDALTWTLHQGGHSGDTNTHTREVGTTAQRHQSYF